MSIVTGLNRRQVLATTGATALSLGMGGIVPALAATKLRQGYQTNMWGMPTYYLMKSGLLEKRGIEIEEFAVPSGNLTMQQMVARQVDMGTYAGPSFILGHDKGDLVGIAVIQNVGKTAQVMARKDLGLKTVADLKGKKVANQVGSSTGNIWTDQIAPKAGLKKGDYEEIRMNTNDMVAAMVAKTIDGMVTVEPYNAIAEADGIANSLQGGDFFSFDKLPVFMAATPDFVDKNPDAVVQYLKAWLDVGKEFKSQSRQSLRDDLHVLHLEGLQDEQGHLQSGAVARRGRSGLPVRPQRLSHAPRRDPAQGKEDQGNPGLEEGVASGIPGEGARHGVAFHDCEIRAGAACAGLSTTRLFEDETWPTIRCASKASP